MAIIEGRKPLPSHTRFDYEECYAKVILESLFPDKYKELQIADKPDLVNETAQIGIEVTTAIPQKHREALNLWSRIPYVPPKQAEQSKERMRQLGVEYQGAIQAWPPQNYSALDIEKTPLAEVIAAFDGKVKKLNSGQYRSLKQYDLFILSDVWLVDEREEEILQLLVEKNTGDLKYTFVVLTTSVDLYRFNLRDRKYLKIPYDSYHDRQFEWSMKARQMVEDGEKV